RLSYLYGTMELSGQAFELADTNPKAFISAVDLETNGLKSDLAKDLNRQVYGDGTGKIATFTSTTAVNTTQYLQDGMQVDLYSSAGTLKNADVRITGWNDSTKAVTFATSVTAAVGDYITRTGSKDREWPGLAKLISDRVALSVIAPALERPCNASVHTDSNPRASAGARMIPVYHKGRENGLAPTLILTNPGVWSSYWALLSQQRQF